MLKVVFYDELNYTDNFFMKVVQLNIKNFRSEKQAKLFFLTLTLSKKLKRSIYKNINWESNQNLKSQFRFDFYLVKAGKKFLLTV